MAVNYELGFGILPGRLCIVKFCRNEPPRIKDRPWQNDALNDFSSLLHSRESISTPLVYPPRRLGNSNFGRQGVTVCHC